MKKNALVTGASSGIGFATVCELAQLGLDVLGIARRKSKLLELEARYPDKVQTIAADITDDTTYPLIQNHYHNKGNIDYIILSAGQAGPFSPLLNTDPKTLEQILALDVLAPLRLLQQLSEHLLNTHVLVIGSYSAKEARHNWGTYSIGKAAQEMMVNGLKKEAKDGLNVTLYYPGAVDTAIYNAALSQTETNFPDQTIYQSFKDKNLLKSTQTIAKEISAILLKKISL